MIPSDSAQRPTIALPPRLRLVGHVLVLVVDMLVVGCLTLFYDGVVAAGIFWLEAPHHSKSGYHLSETTGLVLITGLLVGSLAVVGLLLRKRYLWALAVAGGLLPLALAAQIVCKIL